MTTLLKLLTLPLAWLVAAAPALAGYISTPSLNDIYGQSAFGSTPVTINWLAPGATVVSSALASIDSDQDFEALVALHQGSANTITAFFVDAINFCGGPGGGIVGCASIGGNVFAVDSSFAAGASGALTLAHELGHNLGLGHVAGSNTNLMNPTVGSSLLSNIGRFSQIAIILASSRVQTATNGSRFIDIIPVAVVSSIPEPHQYLMLSMGFILVGTIARRRVAA